MPGFAMLSSGCEKLIKYNSLFKFRTVACADKRGDGCMWRYPMPGFAALSPAYKKKKLIKYNGLFKFRTVACADKRGDGCMWRYPMPGFAALSPAYKKSH
ncbi:hypothetical protein E3226_008810 [Legionella geestiana]|uniref:hypothetical protein n=1 Tax=Legionella geestiana TaxID=45065 RepID=UPI0011813A79|nr:hypothetical protein [Legionella geestiana]QDQ40481.1 hypothetical protein E3226_008810 [Legionella geestiana]